MLSVTRELKLPISGAPLVAKTAEVIRRNPAEIEIQIFEPRAPAAADGASTPPPDVHPGL